MSAPVVPPRDAACDHYESDGWTRCRRSKSLTTFGWADAKVCPTCGQHLHPSGGGAGRHLRSHGPER